jgi:hypothetical protein
MLVHALLLVFLPLAACAQGVPGANQQAGVDATVSDVCKLLQAIAGLRV